MKPRIIALCGSTRFIDVIAVKAWELERDEHVITLGLHLLPYWYTQAEGNLAEHEGCAKEMDELHLRKIDLADEIYVMNVGGYIGASTRNEIRYAQSQGKTIRWLEPDSKE